MKIDSREFQTLHEELDADEEHQQIAADLKCWKAVEKASKPGGGEPNEDDSDEASGKDDPNLRAQGDRSEKDEEPDDEEILHRTKSIGNFGGGLVTQQA